MYSCKGEEKYQLRTMYAQTHIGPCFFEPLPPPLVPTFLFMQNFFGKTLLEVTSRAECLTASSFS